MNFVVSFLIETRNALSYVYQHSL